MTCVVKRPLVPVCSILTLPTTSSLTELLIMLDKMGWVILFLSSLNFPDSGPLSTGAQLPHTMLPHRCQHQAPHTGPAQGEIMGKPSPDTGGFTSSSAECHPVCRFTGKINAGVLKPLSIGVTYCIAVVTRKGHSGRH